MNKKVTVNIERIKKRFSELVEIDSPFLSERETCDYLMPILKDIGFEIFEDNVGKKIKGNCGNLYCFLDGYKDLKPLLFTVHMDTVEHPHGKKVIFHEDGKITSDGTTILGADDISGIVSILEAITIIKENNLEHRPIEIIFFVAEEIYGLGSKNFDYSKIKSKESYTLDSSGKVGKAVYKAPTLISFEAIVTGKAGHSSSATDKNPHSIAILSEIITKIKVGRVDPESTCNIGVIKGGVASNIIPEICKIEGEVRSLSHEKALNIVNDIKEKFIKTCEKSNVSLDFDYEVKIKAYETSLKHSVVKRFENACNNLKIPCHLLPSIGGSDNNNMEEHGINGIVLASAMNKPHSVEEYSSIDELEKLIKIIIELMTSDE